MENINVLKNTLHLEKQSFQKNKLKSGIMLDLGTGFYSEQYFHEMLVIERKRTERSQKPIILVMLQIQKLFNILNPTELSHKIQTLLSSSTRDIDLKGWYKFNHTLGILYTEVSSTGQESIEKKIEANIETVFGKESALLISVSLVHFPNVVEKSKEDPDPGDASIFYPHLHSHETKKKISLVFKRALDVTGSFGLIIFLSPFFIIIPILIKLTAPGPIFFKQKRIGKGGTQFTFIKFRSMYVNNDSSIHKEFIKKMIDTGTNSENPGENKIFKIKNDPRVTPLGRFLRKSSLDEIPQLFNVLKGDMSLVGPRPAIPYEFDVYHTWHKRRLIEIKPGITGFWQVTGRSRTTFDSMVRLDLYYINNWSVLWDIKLILMTPLAMFKGGY